MMIVGYLFQQPLGCGAVVANAGATMEHEGVVVVSVGAHDLGDLHRRMLVLVDLHQVYWALRSAP